MKLDDVKKLQQKKYREQFGRFLVEGEHLALELAKACASNPQLAASELYVSQAYEHWQSPFKTHLISDKQMAQICDTKTPQGIVAVVPSAALSAREDTSQKAIYLHEIQDPGNLGTILRSLAWFGGFRCLLSPGSVDPFNPKVVRSSMGAIFHTPIELDVELSDLAGRFKRVACLDMQGQSLQAPSFKQADCYLFGNEARGVPAQALSDLDATAFTIAGSGAIDSLNLASTVNICVYELSR